MPLFSLVPSFLVKFEQTSIKDARSSREAYLMPPQTSFFLDITFGGIEPSRGFFSEC